MQMKIPGGFSRNLDLLARRKAFRNVKHCEPARALIRWLTQ